MLQESGLACAITFRVWEMSSGALASTKFKMCGLNLNKLEAANVCKAVSLIG